MAGNPPGTTIFSGGGSIRLDSSANQLRVEEEEALEDQRRRNEELGKELCNAFDDLIEHHEEDDTLNSLNYRSNYSELDDEQSHKPPPHPPGVVNGGATTMASIINDQPVKRLRLLLESKNREFENVTHQLRDKSRELDQQTGEMRKKLLLMEAEKERAVMTLKQTHELLVESKTKVSGMEDTIEQLRGKVKTLEDQNVRLEGELEQKDTLFQDALHRYHMVEQNINMKADRHTDALLKQAEEKHNAKVAMMQQQIDNLRSELDNQRQECRRYEARYTELQRSRETLLVDKTTVVQQLQKELEDSQRQCSKLLSNAASVNSFGQERVQLQTRINALEQQTEDMQRTINNLTHRLDASNAELMQMDLGGAQGDNEGGQAHDTPTNFARTMMMNVIRSTPVNPTLTTDDRATRLKNELLLCMNVQKEMRETIRKLNTELGEKDEQLAQLKKDESHALVQMNQYKEEAFRLSSKCNIFKQELEKQRAGGSKQNDQRSSFDRHQEMLEDKIFALQQTQETATERADKLQQQKDDLANRCKTLEAESKANGPLKLELEKQKFLLKDSQNECERLKKLYVEISGRKDEICRELAGLQAQDSAKEISVLQEKVATLERALQLAELKSSELGKLLEKEKDSHEAVLRELQEKSPAAKATKHHSNSCTKCIDSLAQVSKLEIENLKLQNTCASYLREIGDLKATLTEGKTAIEELHQKLDLKAERDELIDELKRKAAQFEEFMRNQSSNSSGTSTRDSGTSPMRIESRDQSVGTGSPAFNDDDPEHRRLVREQEHKIREEMARAFAAEIQKIEEKFKAQFLRFEENIDALKQELHDRVSELKVRTQEVEVLKYAIVTEREKMTEILGKKDSEARSLFDKQSEVMNRYKVEVENGHKKVQFLEGMLNDKRQLVQTERESMEKLIRQITDERKMYRDREEEMMEKFKELEREYEKNIEHLTEKYQSAKKTALNYKKYSEDKEQHMIKEYERIKEGYNTALLKVQNRMKEAFESNEKTVKEKLQKLEDDYEEKLRLLKQST